MIIMEQYKPIELNKKERPLYKQKTLKGRLAYLLWYLTNKTHIQLYIDNRFNLQINRQLEERKNFPYNEWKKWFNDEEICIIEEILEDTAVETRLNHYFIPEDRLEFYLCYPVDDGLFTYLAINIENMTKQGLLRGKTADILVGNIEAVIKKKYAPKTYSEELMGMVKRKYTLKMFFEELIRE